VAPSPGSRQSLSSQRCCAPSPRLRSASDGRRAVYGRNYQKVAAPVAQTQACLAGAQREHERDDRAEVAASPRQGHSRASRSVLNHSTCRQRQRCSRGTSICPKIDLTGCPAGGKPKVLQPSRYPDRPPDSDARVGADLRLFADGGKWHRLVAASAAEDLTPLNRTFWEALLPILGTAAAGETHTQSFTPDKVIDVWNGATVVQTCHCKTSLMRETRCGSQPLRQRSTTPTRRPC